MKNAFGKIGLGLAGAVAAVGFLAMSPAPVSAEIVLSGSSPVVSETLPNYLYDYTVDLADGATLSNSSTTLSHFSISWLPTSGVTAVTYTGDLGNSSLWSITSSADAVAGDSLTATYIGTASTPTSGPAPSNGVTLIGDFILTSSTYKESVTNTWSSATPGTVGYPDTNSNPTLIPDTAGTITAPLPLPAAFWPGLMTLGGMAVVGGLRLRRRAL